MCVLCVCVCVYVCVCVCACVCVYVYDYHIAVAFLGCWLLCMYVFGSVIAQLVASNGADLVF